MRNAVRIVLAGLLTGLLIGPATSVVRTAGAAPPHPSARPAPGASETVSRRVRIEVENANFTGVACDADDRSYRLRARLVGPRSQVLGSDAPRINVLVHDMSTGSWFWNLRSHPAYDYASRLAQRGETSLVLDRLGYDANPLSDGHATCLGAHAEMLHQVVQHLRSGRYDFATIPDSVPAARQVVLHGHSVGAAIAQLEAATYDDVDGLVLMSWADARVTDRALEEATRQSTRCLRGREYARFVATGRAYRRLHFATAPRDVQRTAVDLRNADPCGDVLSLGQTVLGAPARNSEIEAPVLLLFGSRDRLVRDGAAQEQGASYSSAERVRTHVIEGAGNALPLERTAAETRRRVVGWLCVLGC